MLTTSQESPFCTKQTLKQLKASLERFSYLTDASLSVKSVLPNIVLDSKVKIPKKVVKSHSKNLPVSVNLVDSL